MPFSIAWTWKTEFVVTWRQKIYWKKCFFVRRERNSESEIIGLASEGKKPLRLREGQLTRSSGHVCFGSASRVSFSHSTRLHSHDFTNAPDLSLVKKWGLINSSAHWRILSFQISFIVHGVCTSHTWMHVFWSTLLCSPLQSEVPSAAGRWGPSFVFWKVSSRDDLTHSAVNNSRSITGLLPLSPPPSTFDWAKLLSDIPSLPLFPKVLLKSEKVVFVTLWFLAATKVWKTAAAASDGGNCLPSLSLTPPSDVSKILG